VSLSREETRRLRALLDDVSHAAHVADEPARDWGAWAGDSVGADSLTDLTAEQAVRIVELLRDEQIRLRSTAATPDAGEEALPA
jgi:hypothetical protein